MDLLLITILIHQGFHSYDVAQMMYLHVYTMFVVFLLYAIMMYRTKLCQKSRTHATQQRKAQAIVVAPTRSWGWGELGLGLRNKGMLTSIDVI